ncbi:hypothetical protein DSECCO2_456680 [anaerobic digester metagenome]
MEARVVLEMTLAVRDSTPAPAPEPATPALRPMMSAVLRASRSRVAPAVTDEETISLAAVLAMTLAPMRAPAATAPVPATLTAAERMREESCASRSTAPAVAVTSEPPAIRAVVELAMTLPKPVAFTATAPEPATPTVRAMMPESVSLSRTMSPRSEVTVEFEISVATPLAMTLPVNAPLTATPPVPATLTLTARMFAPGSRGEPSSAASRSLRVSSSGT